MTVTADDGDETSTQTFSWMVIDKQSPTPVGSVANQSNVEGSTITDLDVAGNFSDDDSLTYTASGLPAGLSISAAGVISGTIAADAQGVYSVTVTADDGDETSTQTFSWTVSDKQSPTPVGSVANQSNVEGSTITDLDVAGNFSDDDSLTYTASGLPAGLSISSAGVISGTIAADAQGVYGVTVTADDGDETTTQTFSWTVSDDISGNENPIITSLASNATFTNTSADGVVTVTGSYSDVNTPDIHSVTIQWGDGTQTVVPATNPAIDQNADTFNVTHAYANGGIFDIAVTVNDDAGGTSQFTTSQAVVLGVGVNNGVLQIVGSNADEKISVRPKWGRPGHLRSTVQTERRRHDDH